MKLSVELSLPLPLLLLQLLAKLSELSGPIGLSVDELDWAACKLPVVRKSMNIKQIIINGNSSYTNNNNSIGLNRCMYHPPYADGNPRQPMTGPVGCLTRPPSLSPPASRGARSDPVRPAEHIAGLDTGKSLQHSSLGGRWGCMASIHTPPRAGVVTLAHQQTRRAPSTPPQVSGEAWPEPALLKGPKR